MPLFQLLTILLGRKRALDVWLARQTSGNGGVAHVMEFARIPLHNTEFHRQGLQANPAGHRYAHLTHPRLATMYRITLSILGCV